MKVVSITALVLLLAVGAMGRPLETVVTGMDDCRGKEVARRAGRCSSSRRPRGLAAYEEERRRCFLGVPRGGSYASVSVVFSILYLFPCGDSKSTTSCTPSRAGMPGASCERLGPRLSPARRDFFFFFPDWPVLGPQCSRGDFSQHCRHCYPSLIFEIG